LPVGWGEGRVMQPRMKKGGERRRSPRIPLCLFVTAECDGWMGVCYTRDISDNGLFLISQRLPSMAVAFSLEVQLPADLGVLKAKAGVVRVQGDNPRGFGLEWNELKKAGIKQLKTIKEHWAAAFPEAESQAPKEQP
jgi:hypothetical protein